eukprot:CAMPEP_0178383638 /NCGR_PEP_ID=MMETSP0689_2-20121128/7103_1 /TAXON_ID=160604 /ORGANISM="Amphidinium massartii, Strain CS-259" /LENGTH=186 /DNA_ID=CAMNT_0020003861 /DNA_START=115 /DNA_END=675 /DNA_ORIENTATION=+
MEGRAPFGADLSNIRPLTVAEQPATATAGQWIQPQADSSASSAVPAAPGGTAGRSLAAASSASTQPVAPAAPPAPVLPVPAAGQGGGSTQWAQLQPLQLPILSAGGSGFEGACFGQLAPLEFPTSPWTGGPAGFAPSPMAVSPGPGASPVYFMPVLRSPGPLGSPMSQPVPATKTNAGKASSMRRL